MSEKFVKIIFNCYDCGNDTECYGPFDSEKLAEQFEPTSNIAGMTCINTRVIPLLTLDV